MNKFIRSAIVSLALLLGTVSPTLIHTNISYANNDEKGKGTLSAFKGNTSVGINANGEIEMGGLEGESSDLLGTFLGFIKLLSGAGALVMLMFFVINFVKLGASGTNANARAQAISGLVWSGIATVCLSMSLVIFLFFFNIEDMVKTGTSSEDSSGSSGSSGN